MQRSWRGVLVLVAILLLAGCASGGVAAAPPPPPFAWRQFRGATLRVLLTQSHWQQVIAPHLPEFEQLTGIRLITEVYPQTELWDILENGLAEPGRVDVFMTVPGLDGLRYVRAGEIQPVNAYLHDPRLTTPDYTWEDFLPRTRAAMTIEDTVLGPPVMAEHLAVLYRKDLFKQFQVAVPRTLDELEAAARFLHKKPMDTKGTPGFGVVSRGQGPIATSLYAGVLHALGGSWLDAHRRPTINDRLGLAALDRLGRLLGTYAPPNISDFGWQEASAIFLEGRAAMYIEGSSIYPLIEESSKSQVRGKVGYTLFPSGPGGPGTTVAVRGLAIAKQSAHPEAAWLFLQWASGKEMVREALRGGVLVGRQSTWQDRTARTHVPEDLAQSFQEAGRIGSPEWAPPMVAVTAAREAVGKAIVAAVRGEGVDAAAATAAHRLAEILSTTEGPESRPARVSP